MRFIFTSEAVTEGHPDKIADRIADSILDEILKRDKFARVACEVSCTKDNVFIFGEITANFPITNDFYEKIARDTIKEIGYTKHEYIFSYDTVNIVVDMNTQSRDIALGVDEKENKDLGAGDQGIMFGYATNETKEYMPLPLYLAQNLAKRLTEVRKSGLISYLRPDGKTQVSIEYQDGMAERVDTILISSQHDDNIKLETLKSDIKKYVIDEIVPKNLIDENTKILINPTGRFVIGGPAGDTGLTGRKIIVDTYGGWAHHGGGSFSGKDPTKVDRSAAYMARYAAKNIVAAGLCDKCEIQLSYAIGISNPVSIFINTFDTEKIDIMEIKRLLRENFDFRPSKIITKLNLRSPIYKNTSVYGHFGRDDVSFPWEELDKVDILKEYLKK